MRRRVAAILVFVLGGLASAHIVGQEPDKASVHVTAFPSGFGRYEPGQWSSLGIQASNTTDADVEAMLAIYFDKDSHTQYARRLWIPAKSTRKTWLPVRAPDSIAN